MAAPGPWVLYNDLELNLGKKVIDLINDDFKVCLVDSSSIAINAALAGATYAAIAADGHEVANGNGYTTTGEAVAPSWTGGGASATSTFDTGNPTWTGADAGFSARAAVLYDATSGYAIGYCLLDSTPADVNWAAGTTIAIEISNVFVMSKA